MQQPLKIIRTDQSKGKSSNRTYTATDKLQYLMDFNSSICQAMAKTMEYLSDFVFVSLANITLARRDSCLFHVNSGIKPDTRNSEDSSTIADYAFSGRSTKTC